MQIGFFLRDNPYKNDILLKVALITDSRNSVPFLQYEISITKQENNLLHFLNT